MQDLYAALALVLVIEGILPFLSPGLMRSYMLKMAQTDDRTLRITGFISMAIGLLLLMWIRQS